MENVFLGNLSLFVSVIVKPGTRSQTGEWAEQKGGGEGEQILRLPGLSPNRSKGNGNV